MSIIGEMYEDILYERDKKIKEFLNNLQQWADILAQDGNFIGYTIVDEYEKHFGINGD